MSAVTLANLEDVVHFEVGETLVFGHPVSDPFCPRGTAYVTAVDRLLGTFTVSSERIDGASPDVIFMNPDDYRALRKALAEELPAISADMSPLQVGIAASVTLAGLGWLIARRNALADRQDSESWAKAVVAWIVALVRGLMRANVGSGGAHNPAAPGATPGPATMPVVQRRDGACIPDGSGRHRDPAPEARA